ncbi:T-complex protein 11-like protein 1 [Babylonia areolata]|uniref:T-complex protein 11-like protein 1 n=1 Tax=Babylonia areolata TaxID=304850 RepID=UPI003FD5525C
MADKSEKSPEDLNNTIDGEMGVDGGAGNDSEGESKKGRTDTPSPSTSPMQAFMVAASPPKFISFEQLMAAASGVKNMSLAHEIAINSDFQLEKLQPEQNSIEKQVRDVMHKAFWDSLESKLAQDPPDFSHALVLIEEVKEVLLMLLLPQHVRLRAQIMEVLDMELIQQKMENDAFDIFYYANYVVGTMARLCAPVRDQRVAALRDLKDVVPLFKEIFEVLELMKMDMANFTIQQIRPYLQQQSVEYERKKFTEILATQQENGTDGLEFTKLWLKRNFEKLQAAETESASQQAAAASLSPSDASSSTLPSPPPSLSSSSQSSKATPANILNEAYIETLRWDHSILYPETLLMDKSRFCELEVKVGVLTTVGAVQLVTYSTVGAPIAGISSLKTTLKDHVLTLLEAHPQDLEGALQGVAEQVKKDVNQCLQQHGFPPLDDTTCQTLQGQITDLASPHNTITTLMHQRLVSVTRQCISRCSMDSLKVPAGFSAVEKELSQVLGQFLRLISHNRSVFGPHYSHIISQLMERQQDLSPR